MSGWHHLFWLLLSASCILESRSESLPVCTFESCQQCLADAKWPRKKLTLVGPDALPHAVPFRIGFCPNGWDTQSLHAKIVGTLVTEMLGFDVEYPACWDGTDCYMAIQGCVGWMNYECDLVKNASAALNEVHLGRKLFPDPLPDIVYTPETWPGNMAAKHFEGTHLIYEFREGLAVGTAGYVSVEGLFAWDDVVAKAWALRGVDLRSWDYLGETHVRGFFDAPERLIADGVVSEWPVCASDEPNREGSMEQHRSMGYTCKSSWWLNPACAALGENWTSRCVVMVEDTWGFVKPYLWKNIAVSNVPVAKLVLGYERWQALLRLGPAGYNVVFYWWQPDATLLQHKSWKISIVGGGPDEFQPMVLTKAAWMPAFNADARLKSFLQNEQFDQKTMDELIGRVSQAINTGHEYAAHSFFDKIACDWIRENEEVWKGWLPSATTCMFGEYFDSEQQLCAPCHAGSYSQREDGVLKCTYCPAGKHSLEERDRCVPCETGRSQSSSGQSDCIRCPQGSYQQTEGSTSCSACGSHENTAVLAAISPDDCTCSEGFYREIPSNVCMPCSEGMVCEFGSDPWIAAGYYADTDWIVFKCWGDTARCTGGLLGRTCAERRSGIACANCLSGSFPSRRDGKCQECKPSNAAALPIASVCGCILLVLFYIFIDTQDVFKQSVTLTFSSLALGQMLTIVQQLNITGNMRLTWPEPIASVLSFATAFSFDLDFLTVECAVPSTPTGHLVGRFLIFVASVLLIFVIYGVVVVVRHGMAFEQRLPWLICAIGTITLIFYIPVVMAAIGPFQCVDHPNGLRTVREYQSVICWVSSEHTTMVVFGVSAMMVPIAYLAMSVLAVLKFSERMRQGDVAFLKMFTFLFARYTPKYYWFALVHMGRSLAFSLITLLPSVVMQILLTQMLMLAHCICLVVAMPWRTYWANMLEVFTTVAMLALLCFASFFVETVPGQFVASVAGGIAICIVAVPVPAVLYGVIARLRHRSRKPFQFFLCHHKAGAGCFARLLKVKLQGHSGMKKRVWLDSDDLKDLTRLFDYPSNQTDNFIVLCTKEIFSRPWCIGEMVFAMRNDVAATRVVLPGFAPPDSNFVAAYATHVPEVVKLTEHGIALGDVHHAIEWIMDKQSMIVPDFVTEASMNNLVKGLLAATSAGSPVMSSVSRVPSNLVDRAAVVATAILADGSAVESSACALALIHMLRPLLVHTPVKMPVLLPADTELPATVTLVLILCSAGIFHNVKLLKALMAAAKLNAKYVPIITDDAFRFPLPNFVDEHRDAITKVTAHEKALADVIQQTFKAIAVVFQPALYSSTEALLLTKAKEVTERMLEPTVQLPSLSWMETPAPSQAQGFDLSSAEGPATAAASIGVPEQVYAV